MATKFKLLSLAKALAIMVLEHPGGPYIKTPFGGAMPIFTNISGKLAISDDISRVQKSFAVFYKIHFADIFSLNTNFS